MKTDLSQDHQPIDGAQKTRRYFAKFNRIIPHLEKVTAITTDEGLVSKAEAKIVTGYLRALSNTFTALSYKHLMAGRVSDLLPHSLNIDRKDSGFPIYQELLQMANDALQVDQHLAGMPKPEKLKQDMIRHILNEHRNPTRLQYALSQRLYYEHLAGRALFWAQNHPQALWQGNRDNKRRGYLVHWASYDSQLNIPTVYILKLEDSGETALPRDEERWPGVQNHLMAQALASLKLVTIARGFDQDFDDLHPKFLRRIHLGPMYSHAFTEQTGPLREILHEAAGEPGLDWALSWTVETLESQEEKIEKSGWFSTVERQIFKLDHFATSEADTGATNIRRSLILPQRPYQVMEERDPPGLRKVRKYVVGPNGQILSHR